PCALAKPVIRAYRSSSAGNRCDGALKRSRNSGRNDGSVRRSCNRYHCEPPMDNDLSCRVSISARRKSWCVLLAACIDREGSDVFRTNVHRLVVLSKPLCSATTSHLIPLETRLQQIPVNWGNHASGNRADSRGAGALRLGRALDEAPAAWWPAA